MINQNKKEALAAYKERVQIGGVCVIKNTVTGHMLLLSGANLQSCKNRFDFSKTVGSCVSMKLQKDWNEFGSDILRLKCSKSSKKGIYKRQRSFKRISGF